MARTFSLIAAAALLALVTFSVVAQTYPVKTVRYIVPMSAGSGADTIGRIVAAGMTQVFGQQMFGQFLPGAPATLPEPAYAQQ